MLFDWYRIFNLDDFLATGLVSRSLRINFLGIGVKTVHITRGNLVSVQVDDAFVPLEMNGENPYMFDNRAVYLDVHRDVWLGFPQ